jgi:transcriptional regulator with XRE-family HTH domain
MEILTPGEKIKLIRKKYKITQEQLTHGIMSRSMLSHIENNVYSLNKDFLILLVDRLNNLIPNESEKIKYSDIYISKDEQLKNFANDIIKNIKNIDKNKIDEIHNLFSNSTNIYEKVRVYTTISTYLYNKCFDRTISRKLLEEILDLTILNKFYSFSFLAILSLQRIYYKTDISLINNLYYKTEHIIKNFNNRMKGLLIYNFAVFWEEFNDIDLAINLHKKALEYNKKWYLFEWGYINLGTCYNKNKQPKEALTVFTEILSFTQSNVIKKQCYSNILVNAIALNEKTILKINIPKAEKIIEKLNIKDRHQGYYCLAKAYLYLEDRCSAMINFEKELSLGFNLRNPHFFVDKYTECILQLTKIYCLSELKKFKKLEKYFLDIPFEYLDKKFAFKMLEIFSKVYSKTELESLLYKLNKPS